MCTMLMTNVYLSIAVSRYVVNLSLQVGSSHHVVHVTSVGNIKVQWMRASLRSGPKRLTCITHENMYIKT